MTARRRTGALIFVGPLPGDDDLVTAGAGVTAAD
jgi:hypothetical protein